MQTEVPDAINITVDVKQIQDNSKYADGIIYGLAGHKVQNPGRGIYIQNNRKILK